MKTTKRKRLLSVEERIVNNLKLLYGFDTKTAWKVFNTGINPLFVAQS